MKKRLHKKYVILSTILSLFFFGLVLFGIYVVDPAGVNNKFNLGLIKDSALASRTQKFVEINEFKPNTILLGGSRVHFLDTEDVKKYTNDKVYNLALSSSTLEEQYYFLKYSIENFDIKNVVIGLNLYPFSENALERVVLTDFDKEIFETGFTLQKQMKHYSELPLATYVKNYISKRYTEALYKNGGRTAYNQNLFIDHKSWSERKDITGYVDMYTNYLEEGDKGLNIFKDIVKLSDDNNINLKVFTTAVHIDQLQILEDLNKMDIYYKWKEEIAKITPYWDFMYPNTITINADNYIDTSHIRQEKGYLYFAKLFNDNSVDIPSDFGRLVDGDNINEHLLRLKQDALINEQ